jgi:hypothetical protein
VACLIPSADSGNAFCTTRLLLTCVILATRLYLGDPAIRFSLDLRNAKYIRLGKNFTCSHVCRIEACTYKLSKDNRSIRIGKNVEMRRLILSGTIKCGGARSTTCRDRPGRTSSSDSARNLGGRLVQFGQVRPGDARIVSRVSITAAQREVMLDISREKV